MAIRIGRAREAQQHKISWSAHDCWCELVCVCMCLCVRAFARACMCLVLQCGKPDQGSWAAGIAVTQGLVCEEATTEVTQ